MIVSKEVKIYTKSFEDVLELVDYLDLVPEHSVIFINEEEWHYCNARIVIGGTMFRFIPMSMEGEEDENISDKVIDSSRVDDLDT